MVGMGARLVSQHHLVLPQRLVGVKIFIRVVLQLLMLEGREDLLEARVEAGLIGRNNLL
jgi:hypothetical protein